MHLKGVASGQYSSINHVPRVACNTPNLLLLSTKGLKNCVEKILRSFLVAWVRWSRYSTPVWLALRVLPINQRLLFNSKKVITISVFNLEMSISGFTFFGLAVPSLCGLVFALGYYGALHFIPENTEVSNENDDGSCRITMKKGVELWIMFGTICVIFGCVLLNSGYQHPIGWLGIGQSSSNYKVDHTDPSCRSWCPVIFVRWRSTEWQRLLWSTTKGSHKSSSESSVTKPSSSTNPLQADYGDESPGFLVAITSVPHDPTDLAYNGGV